MAGETAILTGQAEVTQLGNPACCDTNVEGVKEKCKMVKYIGETRDRNKEEEEGGERGRE